MSKRTILALSFLILGITIILFSTGSSILTYDLFGVPAGNILLWLGFIALQVATYISNGGFKKSPSRLGKLIRWLMIALIVISILWFGIAYVLSGNTGFNFSSSAASFFGSPEASILYWNIIYVLVVAPIALSLAYAILRFIENRKSGN